MDYLAALGQSPRVWIMPSQLSPAFVDARQAAHYAADHGIACWEWDDLYCGHPL